MFHRTSYVLLLSACLATSCAKQSQPDTSAAGQDKYAENPETGLPTNPSKRRLPASVKIASDTKDNFGINLSQLPADQASIIRSAWSNYKKILAGGYADCSEAPFAPSDGGTTIYFCDGYDIVRVHGLAGTAEAPGYDYGPSLDFLNGQRIERLKFYTEEQMASLDRPAP